MILLYIHVYRYKKNHPNRFVSKPKFKKKSKKNSEKEKLKRKGKSSLPTYYNSRPKVWILIENNLVNPFINKDVRNFGESLLKIE